ncbi:hypothetical protein F4604DRAFT_1672263 [Suillus subluteus]|nr:hypothetical protein F4604DRAFT_1672263 [Suillus subluteus]
MKESTLLLPLSTIKIDQVGVLQASKVRTSGKNRPNKAKHTWSSGSLVYIVRKSHQLITGTVAGVIGFVTRLSLKTASTALQTQVRVPMIEPLAAAVVNSLIWNTWVGPIRRPLLRDFFTPTAGQWKGKEKAVEQDVDYAQCAECAEWLLGVTHEPCCVMRHSVWCPTPETLDVIISPLNHFLSFLQENHPFNLDDAWNAYQMLVDSDDYQHLKPLDVLNFAQKLSAATEAYTIYSTLANIPDAASLLAKRRHWGLETRQRMGILLLDVFCCEVLAEDATISESTNTRHKFFISTGMFLAAHQGDIDRAEEYYSQLSTARWITLQDKALPEEWAKSSNYSTSSFPNPKKGPQPSLGHYTIVVYAHAERADYDGLNFWLQAMSKAGLVPDIYVYSIILKSFAARGEVERDPVSAEAIYKRALREGITPDRKMITSLMNAHVEAGSWAGVVRVFDYLKSSRTPRLRLSIEVYNTLLKAYVLIGAPFHVVSTIFRKLEAMGVQPNGRMYTLIIQSACDAGYMNVANKIFAEMQAAAKDWQTTYRVDAFVLTIIMAGHLRLGDKRRAKAVYDDMCERGIQPTSATFHHILRAYGNERTEESFQIAEGFLKTIMAGESSASWIPPQTRAAALEHVYGPLMLAYTKTDKPEEVERLFQSMLNAGGEPSLGSLSVLLDAYRRSGDIEAIHGLWPQIWQLALRFSKTDSLFEGEDDDPSDPTKRQGNLLCVPLSIYIDALSAAGEHFVIAEMWGKARSHGFSFDSHNWNHLAVALVRAGEPERAFEIVERVLLPYQRQSEGVLRDRDLSPDSPLTFDVSPADVSKPVSQSPMHRSGRRAYQSKVATKRSGNALEMDPTSDDFAHPLHILHQLSPSWNVWRPHRAVLDLLSGVLRHLESGTPVQPVGAHSSAPQALDPNSGDGFTRGYLAREMLDRIYLNYPDTIQSIRLHERWTARKSSLTRQDDGW